MYIVVPRGTSYQGSGGGGGYGMRTQTTNVVGNGFAIGCRKSRRYRLTVTVECAPEDIIGIKEAIAAWARLCRNDTIEVTEI